MFEKSVIVTGGAGYIGSHAVLAFLEAGIRLDVRAAARRPGDPATLVADASRLRNQFAWRPRYDDLGVIVRTAIDWERKLAGEARDGPSGV